MREIAKLHLQSDDQIKALIESRGTVAQWEIPCQAIQSPMLPDLELLPARCCKVHALDIPIAIIVAGGLLFFPYLDTRGVPFIVERDHPSDTGVEGSSSLVDSLPGINQIPRNAAMLSVIITTPAAPLTTDNRV